MGLKKKLTVQGSPLSKNNGGNVSIMPGTSPQSKLHNDYSINGNPNIVSKPTPSVLDLDGLTPSNQYRNTAPPEGVGRI
jgi:hypothetical protein